MNSTHTFNFKFIGVVIEALALLTILAYTILIPSDIGNYELTKSSIVSKISFSLFLLVAFSYGVMYLSLRIILLKPISPKKILSDCIFLNTLPCIVYILGLMLLKLDIFSIGLFFIMLATITFYSIPVYLITMYTKQFVPRIPIFFGVLIYIAFQLIILAIFGEVLRNMVIDFLQTQIPFLGSFLR